MKLSEKQRKFSRDILKLEIYATALGFEYTFGEAQRTQAQQLLYFYGKDVIKIGNDLKLVNAPKKSKTLNSLHADKLAKDYNFFLNGEYVTDFETIKPLGDYWELLDEKNRWGGDWNKNNIADGFLDTPHFERQL